MSERLEGRAAVFTDARPLLFSIAYRLMGSVVDAEDLVEETYLRWRASWPTSPSTRSAIRTSRGSFPGCRRAEARAAVIMR